MRYFPLFLNLQGKQCLVVGAGQVGQRKILRLIEYGAAQVHVLDPFLPEDLKKKLQVHERIKLATRHFEAKDLENKFLVIASTSDQKVNEQISELCDKKNILCNVVDKPELCTFILPAVITQGDLNIAISTSGKSPALARQIKERLTEFYGSEYSDLLILLGRLRPLIQETSLYDEDKKKLFHSLLDDNLLETIKNKDDQNLIALLQSKLPKNLHPYLTGLINELFHIV